MKKIAVLFLGIFIMIAPVHGVIIQVTGMENSETKKKVILLGDMHNQSIIDRISDKKSLAILRNIEKRQKLFFEQLIQDIFNKKSIQKSSTVFITETNTDLWGRLCEEEAGFVKRRETHEIVDNVSRALLRTSIGKHDVQKGKYTQLWEIFFRSHASKKRTLDFINETLLSRTEDIPAFIDLNSSVRWIIGDRYRDDNDKKWCFAMYYYWRDIVKDLYAKRPLPDNYSEFTLEFFCNYSNQLAQYYAYNMIEAPEYDDIIMPSINAMYASGNIDSVDHMARLYQCVTQQQGDQGCDQLNNAIITFISRKYDLELQKYSAQFDADETKNCLLVLAGNAHTDFLAHVLKKSNYKIVFTTPGIAVGEDLAPINNDLFLSSVYQLWNSDDQNAT